jgi:hypothetical protein
VTLPRTPNQPASQSLPSARIHNAKLILTIPSTYVSSPKSLYTTVIHLVHLCLFPEKAQQEIEERGKPKEIFQWDTFVRALGRVLDVYNATTVGEGKSDVVDKGKKRETDGNTQNEDQVGNKRKRVDEDNSMRSGKERLVLMLILQDAQALPKILGTVFESLLRLPKMVSHTKESVTVTTESSQLLLTDGTPDQHCLDFPQTVGRS